MKRLILVGGTMGIGKTTVCRKLQKLLAPAVFLDGDWCWDMEPFAVTEENKEMVLENIGFLLRQFLRKSGCETVIFCWVMHRQDILDRILGELQDEEFSLCNFSLTCTSERLRERLLRDIENGIRTPDVIERTLPRLPLYEQLDTVKINADLPADEVVAALLDAVAEIEKSRS